MEAVNSLLWFRKCLRLHDNPALEHACRNSRHLYPVFVLDSWYLDPDPTAFSPGSARAGVNRIQFMLESLDDLDCSLKKLGSRLLLFRGDAADVIIELLKRWNIGKLCFEFDTEPYGLNRDRKVKDFASSAGIEVLSPVSHTLFNPEEIIQKNGGKPPLTYQSFLKLAGSPQLSIALPPQKLPSLGDFGECVLTSVPRINELGYGNLRQEEFSPFRGGESEALKRLGELLNDKTGFLSSHAGEWVACFDKPKGDPTALSKPATTVLSPYLKFGCLSSRYFYQRLQDVYKSVKNHTSPPVSLVGQLLWRDFFYTVGFGTPNFDQMKGNRICKQIPWNEDDALFVAWREAKTGYPWIDAVMVQLHRWGWVHHLARHAVACFLTRGDLFIHWEKGRDVFERLLIDSDWSINNGNWLWLSCSSFFYQYHRIYSPTTFGKKYDPDGNFIRHFIPVLRDMPKEYIYEPWTAPLDVQRKASCIIGKDYPRPVIDHAAASNDCKRRLAAAYTLNKKTNNLVSEEEIDLLRRELGKDQTKASSNKKQKV